MSSMTVNFSKDPTIRAFLESRSEIKFIMGPFGSGKTSALIQDMLATAMTQQPDADGLRVTSYLFTRTSYPELMTSTIPSFKDFISSNVCQLKGGPNSPITGESREMALPDGTRFKFFVTFIGLGESGSAEKIRSTAFTRAYIDELSQFDKVVFDTIIGRIDRFPKKIEDPKTKKIIYGPTYPGISGATNPPSIRHWIYTLCEVQKPVNVMMYKQPGALIYDADKDIYIDNPEAENISRIGYEYYHRITRTSSKDQIQVQVLGEYGSVFDGEAVFKAYDDRKHIAITKMKPDRAPILCGMDFGLTPALVIGQLNYLGNLKIYKEITADDSVTLESFIDDYILPVFRNEFAGLRVRIIGDPAGRNRDAKANFHSFDMLKARGFDAVPAATNAFKVRKDAVTYFLTRTGGFEMNPDVTLLREALNGGYQWARAKADKGLHDNQEPIKNVYSHVADALQYLCVYCRSGDSHKDAMTRLQEAKPKNYRFI